MQPRPARTLWAELHGSSGAKERRHQDDRIFQILKLGVAEAMPFQSGLQIASRISLRRTADGGPQMSLATCMLSATLFPADARCGHSRTGLFS
jgi:hypothetical protein